MSYKDDVRLIKALADENRLAILELLQGGEKCGCVLLEELRITQPTLSHHMKILCDTGIVDSCKDGKWMHYSLSLEGSNTLREMVERYSIGETDYKNYKKCDSCRTE
ncbi:MAG: ArsR family transcriptional regulator [Clostridia bacterium]|nr:metalloregulator ArsR/SmtB family transcription factor [Lachnospiraceae bacterium]NCC01826.1 ArsR family transcriptional regulator [Clostridia bacterium]NCD03778.1 ArsR family transcriptional regulator [Clostridia bacterium]